MRIDISGSAGGPWRRQSLGRGECDDINTNFPVLSFRSSLRLETNQMTEQAMSGGNITSGPSLHMEGRLY